MKIEFYSEFPEKDLEKLRLINFPSRIFIAAKSLKEFKNLERKARQINKKVEFAYWPLVKNSYWISPFSNNKDLVELFKELNSCKNHLLIDLELPFLNKKLILRNLFNFLKNRKLIEKFLEENKAKITTAQFPTPYFSWLAKFLGLNYSAKTEKSLMWYSSMISKANSKRIKKYLRNLNNKNIYSVSLGTIAVGILGNEKILSPQELKKDLEFVKENGFEKIVIFRLGGLNKDYLRIIKNKQIS